MSRKNPFLEMSSEEVHKEFIELCKFLHQLTFSFGRKVDADLSYVPPRKIRKELCDQSKTIERLMVKFRQAAFAFDQKCKGIERASIQRSISESENTNS